MRYVLPCLWESKTVVKPRYSTTLTGTHKRFANYAGVTVERKVGHFQLPSGRSVRVWICRGTYSLQATSPDEITRDVCQARSRKRGQDAFLLCVVNATSFKSCIWAWCFGNH